MTFSLFKCIDPAVRENQPIISEDVLKEKESIEKESDAIQTGEIIETLSKGSKGWMSKLVGLCSMSICATNK